MANNQSKCDRIRNNYRAVREYLYDHQCVTCHKDEIFALKFERINRNTKAESVTELLQRAASFKKIAAEIVKCKVICANCRMKSIPQNKTKTSPKLLSYLKSNPCTQCGETDPSVLEINSTKRDKRQVLCANCHEVKKAAEVLPAVYIASSIRNCEMVKNLTRELELSGIVVTYKWHKHGPLPKDKLPEAAEREVTGVLRADLLIALLPGGLGTHVEIGMAIGNNIPVILHPYADNAWEDSTGKLCAFHYYKKMHVVYNIENVVRAVLKWSKSAKKHTDYISFRREYIS